MPASGGIRLVDANVWLAASADGHTHHARAKEWFDAQAPQTSRSAVSRKWRCCGT